MITSVSERPNTDVPHNPWFLPINSAARDWLLVFELIASVPCPDSLQEVIFEYYLTEEEYPNAQYGYEQLPWGRLRDVYRRFVNIEFIQVEFRYGYDEETVTEEKIETHRRREVQWQECARHEMRDFKEVFVCGEPE